MESYGAILKKAREDKLLDLETVARDTAITRQYIEALEKEDSYVFPGEPYLVGFLKNYADYLGLDVNRVVSLYRAKVLQETMTPVALTAHEKPKWLIPLIILLIIIVTVSGFCVGAYLYKVKKAVSDDIVAVSKSAENKKYELTQAPFQGRVYKGDQLIMGTPTGNIILSVACTSKVFGLETPVGVQYIELSEEIEVDVDGDSRGEIIVYVSDVSSSDNDRGAEVRILLKDASSAAIGETVESEIPNAEELPANQKKTVVLEDSRAYPFTINATFRAGCLFRYRVDRKDLVESYYSTGEIVNMTASNGTRLWVSNGNAVKLQVIANGVTYDLGVTKGGEVVAEDIKWIKDTDGKFKLVVTDLD